MSTQINDDSLPLLGAARPASCFPLRYALTGLLAFGFFQVYALRVCLSVAVDPMQHEFGWSDTEAGVVLSAFFWGYMITQLPGGYLAQRFGAKHLLTFSVAGTAILTLLTPIVAHYTGAPGVVVIRVLEGLGEAASYPAAHAWFSHWAPICGERTTLPSIAYAGSYLGTIVAFPISGALSQGTFLGGWPATFYVFGSLGLIWSVLWHMFGASTPSEHPKISRAELLLLLEARAKHSDGGPDGSAKLGKTPIPWGSFVRSEPFWAMVLAHFAVNWAFYTCLTLAPTYIKKCLGFDLEHAGFLSTLPYVAIFIIFMISGRAADVLIQKGFEITRVRRCFQTACFAFSTASFVALASQREATPAIALLTAAVGFLGLAAGGFNMNHIDIGGEFAGILMGCTNTVATLGGIVSPALSDALVGEKDHDPASWAVVFYIAAGIQIAAMIGYLLGSSAKRQFFARPSL